MKTFKLLNNVVGWVIFAIAAFTYISTVEPSASFWDCPEFITTAMKLEVGHPPGAPFFMLTGNLFSHLASDPSQVAYWINVMSALLSAFCILFLFWSITHLARKLICADGIVQTTAQALTILACGVTGALAYTWSDTFWFSAVEGEVYAYSSMFTALVFWLILKWEDNADAPHSDRWLVLIFYLTGLSIGVHLLNLLCLPAIVLVYYYKKTPEANLKGSLLALGVSIVLVAAVLYGVVPGIVKVGGWFELLFVNGLSLPFNSGMVIYILTLIAVVSTAIWATTRHNRRLTVGLYVASVALLGIPFYGHGYVGPLSLGVVLLAALYALLFWKREGEYVIRKRFLNTSLLCMLMLMVGYSSYALIVLRSTQNTPMDQNSPEDIFTLGTYLNREQYGTRPLFYGEAFTSLPYKYGEDEQVQRHEKKNPNEPDRYDIVKVGGKPEYPSGMKMLFPRMYSRAHTQAYNDWLGGVDLHATDVTFVDPEDGQEKTIDGEMPSQVDNLRFFLSYQVNFMYWRYFMWNFSGRQNDIQSHGELDHGNWITGITPVDNLLLHSDQSKLPDVLKDNKGHNVFYMLPLLLGLLGLFWQAYRGKRGVQQFWVVFFLFFMTGLAIVLYLNQTPQQPRERDYAYAGSFYAFAIWIGLGVAAIADGLRRLGKLSPTIAAGVAAVLGVAVPLQMVSQTWDDHDRSDRYAARDFGANYLHSLDEKGSPIIFTNGDNDTFPLWYGQDVEGTRTDARVCNLSYLQTDWYTDQMRRPAWNSPGLPITWKRWEYVDNMGNDFFRVHPSNDLLLQLKAQLRAQGKQDDPFELRYIIDHFVRNPEYGYIPTDSIVMTVDKAAVLKSGMKLVGGKDSIPDKINISLRGKRLVTKSEMMVYEMLANHDWTRPLYMSTTLGTENYAGLDNNLMLEGLAFRIVPYTIKGGNGLDSDRMYDNMMRKFRYGNMKQKGIYVDETVMRMCYTHRAKFVELVGQLLREGKKDKALRALQKCKAELPEYNVPYDFMSLGYDFDNGLFKMPEYWRQVGRTDEAERILLSVGKTTRQYLEWYNTMSEGSLDNSFSAIYRLYMSLVAVEKGLENCGSKQAAAYKSYLNRWVNTPGGQMLTRRMMQERQRELHERQGTADGMYSPADYVD